MKKFAPNETNKSLTNKTLESALSFLHKSNQSYLNSLPESFPREAYWYDGKWAHEHSNIPQNPNILYGRLDNGLRYAIIPHKQDSERISMFLNVQAGSLMEAEEELGVAHFVEHMAFNGSKNFPAGSLIPFFQEHGMSFGGDTNAHTSLAETVYKLNLAQNSKESLEVGLKIFRDFADGLLFEEKSVEEEKNVILAEKTSRNTEARLAGDKRKQFLYPDTKFINTTIGEEHTISNANSAKLKNFYETWYTADRMTLVIVGDVEKQNTQKLIEQAFSSMNDRTMNVVAPWGNPTFKGLRVRAENRPISGDNVSILFYYPRFHQHDSEQLQYSSFIDTLLSYVFNRRLHKFVQDNAKIWNTMSFTAHRDSVFLPVTSFSSTTKDEQWQKAIEGMSALIIQLEKFGVSQQELDDALKSYKRKFEQYVENYPNQTNGEIAAQFVSMMNKDKVYTSIEHDIEFINKFIEKVSTEDLNKEVKNIFTKDNAIIIVSSDNPPSEEEILFAWEQAQDIEVEAPEQKKEVNYPYLSFPTKEKIGTLENLQKKHVVNVNGKDVNTYHAKFENGIDFYAIPSVFSTGNSIGINIIYGDGLQTSSLDKANLLQVANSVINGSGLGRLSLEETREVLLDLNARPKESYALYSSSLAISGEAEKAEQLLQALYTQYLDPTPIEYPYLKLQESLKKQEYALDHSIDTLLSFESENFFYGNPKHYDPLSLSDLENFTYNDIEQFIKAQRGSDGLQGPVKMIVTGDIKPEEAYRLSAQYFSHIKITAPKKEAKELKKLTFPAGGIVKKSLPDSIDKAKIRVARNLNLDNLNDRKTFVHRKLATSILKDKLRADLREKMGAVYTPSVVYKMHSREEGYGLLIISVDSNKKNQEMLTDYITNIKPWDITTNELERLRAPLLSSIDTSKKTDKKWLNIIISEIDQELPYIEWDKTAEEAFRSATAKDVTKALQELLEAPQATWAVHSIVD